VGYATNADCSSVPGRLLRRLFSVCVVCLLSVSRSLFSILHAVSCGCSLARNPRRYCLALEFNSIIFKTPSRIVARTTVYAAVCIFGLLWWLVRPPNLVMVTADIPFWHSFIFPYCYLCFPRRIQWPPASCDPRINLDRWNFLLPFTLFT